MRTSVELLAFLKSEGVRQNRKDNLDNVMNACNYLESEKMHIYPASVARYLKSIKQSPKSAQVISNDEDGFLAYVKLRAAEQGLPKDESQNDENGRDPYANFKNLLKMDKEELAQQVIFLTDETMDLKKKNQELRIVSKKLYINPSDFLPGLAGQGQIVQDSENASLLKEFISDLVTYSDVEFTRSAVIFNINPPECRGSHELIKLLATLCNTTVEEFIAVYKEIR